MSWTTIEDAIHAWIAAALSGTVAAGSIRWGQQNAARPAGPFVSLRVISTRSIGQDWSQSLANPLTVADDVVESVDATANTLTLTAHGLLTGDGPLRWTTTGALPAGLAVATDYWAIKVSANAIKVADSFGRAIAASPTPVDLTDAGTGTHTLVDTSDTVRAGAEILSTARGTREAVVSIQAFGGTATEAGAPRALLERVVAFATLPSRRAALAAAGVGIGSLGTVQSVDGVVGASLFEPRATLEARLFITSEVSETSTYIASAAIEDLNTRVEFIVPEAT